MNYFTNIFILILFIFSSMITVGQIDTIRSKNEISIDYNRPQEYLINDIQVVGGDNLDANIIILLSELNIGDKIEIPGQKLTKAIQKLWDQGLFDDVQILISNQYKFKLDLVIKLKERPKLSKYSFRGIKKGEISDLK